MTASAMLLWREALDDYHRALDAFGRARDSHPAQAVRSRTLRGAFLRIDAGGAPSPTPPRDDPCRVWMSAGNLRYRARGTWYSGGPTSPAIEAIVVRASPAHQLAALRAVERAVDWYLARVAGIERAVAERARQQHRAVAELERRVAEVRLAGVDV